MKERPRAAARMWLLAAVVGQLLAACSDGGSTAAPTPGPSAATASTASPAPAASSTPTATSIPLPAGDGLFVYLVRPDRSNPTGPVTLAVFEMSTGRERAAETFLGERPHGATVWRDGVALAFDKRVELADAGLSNRRTVFEAAPGGGDGAAIADVAVSPDGLRLALTVEPAACTRPDCAFYASQLFILDLPSGRELLRLDWPDPARESFDGALWQLRWRDDGQGVWVAGATHSERPGTKATVMLDGSIRIELLEGFVSIAPNGRIAAHGPGSLGCMFISGHRLALLDLDTNTELFAAQDTAFAYTPWEWSPAGEEFVFAARPYTPSSSTDQCDWAQAPPEWRVVQHDGSSARTITEADLLRLRRSWHEGRFVTAGCEPQQNPMLGRYADPAPQCDRSLPPGAIRVNGVDVGRTGPVEIVGFLD